MKIATVLNAHGHTEMVQDTLDSIRTFVGNDILVVIDGASWNEWGEQLVVPAYKLKGFYHNYPKAPYRNLTLGLKTAVDLWPESDWFCYSEPDVLYTSDGFKKDLSAAQKQNVWCIGNDLRIADLKFPYLESMMNIKLKNSYYLLGCCVFYSGEFIRKLKEINFFDTFLTFTNEFTEGHFPDYAEQGGYDFGEHLYPTLANHLGGSVAQFAYWNQLLEQWGGQQFKKYPLRWKPEINWDDNFNEASILHPIKNGSDLRWFHACKRYRKKKLVNI